MRIIPLLIASTIILYACNKSKSETEITQQSDSLEVTDTTKSAAVIDTSTSAVAANSASAKPTLNPAHGEPFHRCDILVGAPIDSAPEQNPQLQNLPPQNTNNSTEPMIPTTTKSVEATGAKPIFNPAHGEPHHRCDLKVGAPLG